MPAIGNRPALPKTVNLREVGLRDGLQNEAPVTTEAKVSLLEALVAAGLRRIEATAFVSPRAVPSMADAEALSAELQRWPEVEWSALVASAGGAERALDAGLRTIEYVVSATDGHSRANVRRSTEDALAAVGPIATAVHDAGGVCEVVVATAWDCPFDGPTPPARVLAVVDHAVRHGVERVCLADTIGSAGPGRVGHLLTLVGREHPDVRIGLHMHDTRGMGAAGILAALQLGIVDIDASIGGLGGCPFAPGAAGNVSTEEVAYLCRDAGVETGTRLDLLLGAASQAQSLVGRQLASRLLRAQAPARNASIP